MTAAIDAPRCSAHVYLAPTNKPPCGKRARVERGGRWYCGQHDPERRRRQSKPKTDQAPSRAIRLTGEWLDGEIRSHGEGGSFKSSGEAGHALHAYLAAHGLQVVDAGEVARLQERLDEALRRAVAGVAECDRCHEPCQDYRSDKDGKTCIMCVEREADETRAGREQTRDMAQEAARLWKARVASLEHIVHAMDRAHAELASQLALAQTWGTDLVEQLHELEARWAAELAHANGYWRGERATRSQLALAMHWGAELVEQLRAAEQDAADVREVAAAVRAEDEREISELREDARGVRRVALDLHLELLFARWCGRELVQHHARDLGRLREEYGALVERERARARQLELALARQREGA
ncbi:MAG: hypothetical protein K8H88_05710 [Sandaracinaceae bacterium]|nr:hypothetical protein [Sandaracinaceae bacterium]